MRDLADCIVATFELAPAGSARALAVEESTGTEAISDALAERVGGVVLEEGDGRATVAWPWGNWGANLPQIMASVVVGEACETTRFTRCRLVAVDWPADLITALGGGPRFGLAGVRGLLGPGAAARPLLGAIVKPSLGLSPHEVAGVAAALARGGCDLVKDDELLADPGWCPLRERVAAVAAALARLDSPCLYAANVSGPLDGLFDRARAAVAGGAGAVMVNAFASGVDAVRVLAAAGLGVPVFAHRVGAGPYARNADIGVDGSVLCELCRMAGADFVQIGGFGGKLFDSPAEVAANLAACRRPLAGARPPVPVNGGGVWAGSVPGILAAAAGAAPDSAARDSAARDTAARDSAARDTAASDIMVLAGSGATEHPGGAEAGARSVRQAIEAIVAGTPLAEAARDAPELAAALAARAGAGGPVAAGG